MRRSLAPVACTLPARCLAIVYAYVYQPNPPSEILPRCCSSLWRLHLIRLAHASEAPHVRRAAMAPTQRRLNRSSSTFPAALAAAAATSMMRAKRLL